MGLHLGLGLTGQRVNASPARLFGVSGSRGFMYDLSDYSTQWQDTAGTVPITTTAQSVARVNDVSGLGNHATQANLANRSLTTTIGAGYRGIQFDGMDDFYTTPAIDFSNSDEVTVVAGVRKLSDAARAMLVEFGLGGALGSVAVEAPGTAAPIYQVNMKGTITTIALATGYAAPTSNIVSAQGKISTDTNLLRVNGAQVATSAADQGTGNMSSQIVYIGRRGGASLPFNGVLTFLFAINRLLTANELAAVEAYANQRTGAY